MAHMVLTMYVIGCTGVGKSSLYNLLSGSPGVMGCDSPAGFGVSSGLDACTHQAVARVHPWLGNGAPVRLIDTPGKNFKVKQAL